MVGSYGDDPGGSASTSSERRRRRIPQVAKLTASDALGRPLRLLRGPTATPSWLGPTVTTTAAPDRPTSSACDGGPLRPGGQERPPMRGGRFRLSRWRSTATPSWSGHISRLYVGLSLYIFRTTDGGATYDQVAKLTASDAAADPSASVAIDGTPS